MRVCLTPYPPPNCAQIRAASVLSAYGAIGGGRLASIDLVSSRRGSIREDDTMTQVTQVLREEHRWIRLLLDCLDGLLTKFRAEGEFDVEAAKGLQALLERFVDQQHQGKEEAALFPKLLECVQRLQDDHATEREHLERMRFNLFNAALGDPSGRAAFLTEAESYLDLQRQHMTQESLGLLPLAEQLLSEEDDEEVLAEFHRLDGEGLGREQIVSSLRGLCERLGVAVEEGAKAV